VALMTADDVAVTLGRPITGDEEDQVEQWLTDVETIISARLGDLSLLDQSILGFVEREAVAARLRNPEGFQSEKIDDYSYSLPANTRQITILDEWWDLLTPGSASGVFSVRPSFDVDSARWPTEVSRALDCGEPRGWWSW
jgi:hypothetical protein